MSRNSSGIEAHHGMARPILIGAVAVVAIAAAIYFTNARSSSTTPSDAVVEQNPTGAGSNPDGAAAVSEDGVEVEETDADIIDGSANATDATGITAPAENTVDDDGRRTLSADEVISPEAGTVNPDTGRVQAD